MEVSFRLNEDGTFSQVSESMRRSSEPPSSPSRTGVQRVYAPPDIVRVGQNVPQLRSDNRKMLTSELAYYEPPPTTPIYSVQLPPQNITISKQFVPFAYAPHTRTPAPPVAVDGWKTLPAQLILPPSLPTRSLPSTTDDDIHVAVTVQGSTTSQPEWLTSTLHVMIHEGRHLPKADALSKCDPFVEIEFNNEIFQTRVWKNTADAFWEEGHNFDLESQRIPVLVSPTFRLYDWDRVSHNDLIGTGYISPQQQKKLNTAYSENESVDVKGMEISIYAVDGSPITGMDGHQTVIVADISLYTNKPASEMDLIGFYSGEEDFQKWIWKSVSDNAYSAFVSIALHDGLATAISQCGVLLIITVFIQLAFVIQLNYSMFERGLGEPLTDRWYTWTFQADALGFCGNGYAIWVAALTVFLLLMFENLPHLLQIYTITIYTREEKHKGRHRKIELSLLHRIIVLMLAFFFESIAWTILMDTGIRFILTAGTVEGLVRSTVALMFIMQIDEMIYKSCSTPALRRRIESQVFRVHYGNLLNWRFAERQLYVTKNFYSLFIHMPLLLVLSLIIVLVCRHYNPTCNYSKFNFWMV